MQKRPGEARLYDLERFQAFKWLLEPAMRDELTTWVKQVLESVASSSAAATAADEQPKKEKKRDSGNMNVMSWFS
eukprot:32977-Lingulodinium_polyedra.AAC.1